MHSSADHCRPAGLRVRSSLTEHGEADISECSLLCEDYRRLGATNVAVDPSVRISYLPWTRDFYGELPGGVGAKVAWPHVVRSGALEQLQNLWSDTRGCMSMQWVSLSECRHEGPCPGRNSCTCCSHAAGHIAHHTSHSG